MVLGPYLTERAAAHSDGGVSMRAPEARLDEAEGLALAIDVELVGRELVMLSQIRPATYLGKGKVEDIAALVERARGRTRSWSIARCRRCSSAISKKPFPPR